MLRKLLLSLKGSADLIRTFRCSDIFCFVLSITTAGSVMVVSAMKCGLFGEFASGKESKNFGDCDQTSMEEVQLLCLAGFYCTLNYCCSSAQSSVYTRINPFPFLICKFCGRTF